jgi:hypothetical protein
MRRKKTDFNGARRIALTLPDVVENITPRGVSFKARGKLLACEAIHKSAEPDSWVVKIGFEQRARLIAADPDVYYVTAHYMNYPSVIVRLAHISANELRDLLKEAWIFACVKPGKCRRSHAAAKWKR